MDQTTSFLRLKENFKDMPIDIPFWEQMQTMSFWNSELIPLGQWDNVIFIACAKPPEELSWSFQTQFIIAKPQQLNFLWDKWQEQSKSGLTHETSNVLPIAETENEAIDNKEEVLTPQETIAHTPDVADKAEEEYSPFSASAENDAPPLPSDEDHQDSSLFHLNADTTKFKFNFTQSKVNMDANTVTETEQNPNPLLKDKELKPSASASVVNAPEANFNDDKTEAVAVENLKNVRGQLLNEEQPQTPQVDNQFPVDEKNVTSTTEVPPLPVAASDNTNLKNQKEWAHGNTSKISIPLPKTEASDKALPPPVTGFQLLFNQLRTIYKHSVIIKIQGNVCNAIASDGSMPMANSGFPFDLNEPSFLRFVTKSKREYHGPIPENETHAEFFKNLGLNEAPQIITALRIDQNILVCMGDNNCRPIENLEFAISKVQSMDRTKNPYNIAV